MRILVTAGPTREYWDSVRFLSNGATGRLGIEIANAAVDAGHEAVLVLGPTHLEPPRRDGLVVHRVVSARDMLAAASDAWPGCHALVATAAVCDFRPSSRHPGKIRKSDGVPTTQFVPNPDVLATLAAEKGSRVVVGFALQVEDGDVRAREKLRRKGLDAIVLDGPAALGADRADFRLLLPDGGSRDFPDTTKADLARALVAFVTSVR